MRLKKIFVFIVAVTVSLAAAHHRWGDSGHAMGLISTRGGQARHPVVLLAGKDHYTHIVTATVLSPYRGNARIILEGMPEADYKIHFQKPVVDFGFRRRPRFEANTLYGLVPRDRIALWVTMTPFTKTNPLKGKCDLAFYDTASDKLLLKVPFIFQTKDDHHAKKR